MISPHFNYGRANMSKEDLELFIRDIGLWDSGGKGETLWIIQIDGLPEWFYERYSDDDLGLGLFVLQLSPEEVEQLGLEQEVKEDYEAAVAQWGREHEYSLEAREVMVFGVSEFFDKYDPPERIKNILMHIPDDI